MVVIALGFLFCFLFNYTVAIICLSLLTILLFTLAYFAPKKKQVKPNKKKPGETNSKLVNLARNAML
jgi:hypothetical protein